ncbi:MAG: alpha/beta fold hydrolase, partial [Eggerthellaceae bacterium]|nr:alpha/beta fold hydrolase [Eggerthellaceae bacterium]
MGKVAKRIIAAIIALCVVFFVASFFIDYYVLDKAFQKRDQVVYPGGNMPTFENYVSSHSRTPVEFTMDGLTLRGYIYESNDVTEPKGFVVFRHGIFSNHIYYLPEIIALSDCGWKVFAFDSLGAGESDGDSYVGMVQSALDVTEAVNYVAREGLSGDLPIVLWGHSWGGYGVAAALNNVPWVKACVTMSGYDDPVDILVETSEGMMGGFAVTQVPTLVLNTKLTFGSASSLTGTGGINATSAPVLIIHGTGDPTVRYDGSAIIANRSNITNPNVEYLEFSEEGRDGHNSYFYSKESNAYADMKRAELKELSDQYPEGIPDDVKAAFYEEFDAVRANTADPGLIEAIDDFLTRAIGDNAMKKVQGFTSNDTDSDDGKYGDFESAYYSRS